MQHQALHNDKTHAIINMTKQINTNGYDTDQTKEEIKMTNQTYKIGYARVSTQDQSLDSQIDALKKVGCEQIFSEKITGTKTDRAKLNEALSHLRSGDTLVVTKLDRLGRTTKGLVDLMDGFKKNNIKLKILDGDFATETPMGEMLLTMMSAFAQLERDLIADRTRKGLESARARGRKGGRPSVIDGKTWKRIKEAYDSKDYTMKEIEDKFGINRRTIYRRLEKDKKAKQH